MTACSNGFAKREYADNERISQMEDHYSKEVSVFNPIDGDIHLQFLNLTDVRHYGQKHWRIIRI